MCSPNAFRLLDHQPGLVESRFCLGCGNTLAMIKSVRKSDLKLDLLATQRGCCRQRRNLVEGTGELGHRFDQRGALQ